MTKPVNKRLLAFYVLIVVSIIGLTYFVQTHPISAFDLYMTREIQALKLRDLTFVMKFISIFGDPGVAPLSVLVAALVFFRTNYGREGWFTLSVAIPDLLNILMKIAVHRPRPTLEDATIFLKFTQSGFPSGHVVHYVALFGFLIVAMFVNKKILPFWRISIGISSALLILTVSISRIYLGAHWATDVLGGYLFGFIYLGVILKFYLNRGGLKYPKFLGQKTQ
jgi:undecaprenyl-diphosphatase